MYLDPKHVAADGSNISHLGSCSAVFVTCKKQNGRPECWVPSLVVVDTKFFCSQRSRVFVIVRNVSVDWSWRLFHRVTQHCCLPVFLSKKILAAVECRRLFAFSGNFPQLFICVMKSHSRWIDDENINNILNAIVSLRNIYLISFDFINSIFSSRLWIAQRLALSVRRVNTFEFSYMAELVSYNRRKRKWANELKRLPYTFTVTQLSAQQSEKQSDI